MKRRLRPRRHRGVRAHVAPAPHSLLPGTGTPIPGGTPSTGASPARTPAPAPTTSPVPSASPAAVEAVLHLVRRATWGATSQLLADVARRGGRAWLSAQLDPTSIADPVIDALMGRFPTLGRSIQQVRAQDKVGSYDTMRELGFATIARYAWSERQLLEVMCDFWSNHLNVTSPSSDVWADRHDYDATVVRSHALGSFTDMLVASARHPSMLRYLNGAASTKKAPNQNYGRELMELHTVGIDAGYGEAGVVAAAKVLTGMTVTPAGGYAFDPARHDGSAATILGWSAPAHDPSTGEAVQTSLLRYLATHHSTATHLATKLCLRFVSDTPPPALVTRLASSYLDAGTHIVPVLQDLFSSPEFAAAGGAKTRRPLEGLLALVRTLGIRPGTDGYAGSQELYYLAADLGQAPLAWAPPNGYPDAAQAWVSAGATMKRWNDTAGLVAGWYPKTLTYSPAATAAPSPAPATYGALVDAIATRGLFRAPTPSERAALLTFCGASASTPLAGKDPWLGPKLPSLLTMVLDAPAHMER